MLRLSFLFAAALLAAPAAFAQVAPVPQVDASFAEATTILAQMRGQFYGDQHRIADLTQQLKAVTDERDALKKAADAPKPAP